jgi:hypothetical protein
VLTIEPPVHVLRGLVIFRDDEDADQFHFLSPVPRLAEENGRTAFTLYKYRRDLTDNPALEPTRARGAGLALFEVETPVRSLALVAADLASETGRSDPRLSPVVFRSGEVRTIVAHAEGDGLVEDLVDGRSAPLTFPHHAAFALALSAEGATLFEAAARGGALPVGVVYELRFLALTPALHAHVWMDYDRIYDHFATSVGFTYYVSVRLDLELAWLVEHDLIKIDIVTFTDAEDQQRQRQMVMDLVAARVQQDFFRTGIPPAPEEGMGGALAQLLGGALGKSEITSASALFVLKAKYEVVKERKDFDLVYEGRTAVELTHVSTGLLSAMASGDPSVLEVDLDDPFFSALSVQIVSVVDFDELADLLQAVVTLARGDHRASYPISRDASGPYRFEVALSNPGDDAYEASVEYHFDPDLSGGPPVVTAPPIRTRQRVLVVNPLADFRYVRVRVLLGPVDPALVPRIHVRLRIPGPDGDDDLAAGEVTVSAEQPEVTWRQHLPLDGEGDPVALRPTILARTEWEDPTGQRHSRDEVEVTGDTLVALGPYRDVLAISVVPGPDWTRTTQVAVEIRYQHDDAVVDRSLLFTPTQAGAQEVRIPMVDPAARGYRWRETVFHADGTSVERSWGDADRSVLVVGREVASTRDVRVVWVGSAGDAFGLRVDFWVTTAPDHEETVATFLRPDQEGTVTLPLDDEGALRYRFEVRRVGPEGETLVRAGEGESDLLVVQAFG